MENSLLLLLLCQPGGSPFEQRSREATFLFFPHTQEKGKCIRHGLLWKFRISYTGNSDPEKKVFWRGTPHHLDSLLYTAYIISKLGAQKKYFFRFCTHAAVPRKQNAVFAAAEFAIFLHGFLNILVQKS